MEHVQKQKGNYEMRIRLNDLLAIQREVVSERLDTARLQLNDLWNGLHFSDEQKVSFNPEVDAPEELLKFYETGIDCLNRLKKEALPVYDKMKFHQQLLQDYRKGAGGTDTTERMMKINNLKEVKKELNALVKDFDFKHPGKPLLVYGRPLKEFIEDQWKNLDGKQLADELAASSSMDSIHDDDYCPSDSDGEFTLSYCPSDSDETQDNLDEEPMDDEGEASVSYTSTKTHDDEEEEEEEEEKAGASAVVEGTKKAGEKVAGTSEAIKESIPGFPNIEGRIAESLKPVPGQIEKEFEGLEKAKEEGKGKTAEPEGKVKNGYLWRKETWKTQTERAQDRSWNKAYLWVKKGAFSMRLRGKGKTVVSFDLRGATVEVERVHKRPNVLKLK